MKQKTLLFLFALLSTLTASAYDAEIDGIYYNFSGTEAAVTYGTQYSSSNYSGTIIIPATVYHDGVNYSVTSIGEYAFNSCYRMTSVTIPSSVITIEESAFDYCSGLTSIDIPNSVTKIGQSTFSGCSGLTSVTIPNSVTTIEGGAFYGCSSLTSISIPNSVTEISERLFQRCFGLTEVNIPNSVTTIGCDAFSECSGLTSIEIPNSVTEIGSDAFEYCSSLTSVTIPNSVTYIGEDIFKYCSSLASVSVGNGNLKYDSRDNCNAIIETATNTLITGCKNTVIPNSVTAIGEGAFSNCSGLKSVTIPNGVTSIGEEAFSECSGLTEVIIPSSVKEIGEEAFSGCYGLTSILVESGNTIYDSRDNCNAIIETITNTLIMGCKNTVIPNNVTVIGEGAFSGCSGLKSVTIPNGVTSIGEDAFSDCSSLSSVTIPNSVTSIGNWAFSSCEGLISLKIGSGVTEIGYAAFHACSKLTEVYCYAENVPSTEIDAFTSYYINSATLHVPEASISTYKTTKPWNEFGSIIELKEQCATPTIDYVNGKLIFRCETENVKFHYEYGSKGVGSEASVGTITVSVYATKEGYEDSDLVTQEVNISGSTAQKGDVNEDGNVNGTDIQEVINIIVNGN